MSTIKEISISSIGEPAHVNIGKNSNGYTFELSLYGDDLNAVIDDLMAARTRIEKELSTTQQAIV